MKDFIKLPFVLMVTTLISASALALINSITKPKIMEARKKSGRAGALAKILPSAQTGTIKPRYKETNGKEVDYYVVYSDQAEEDVAGYILTVSEVGYADSIVTMVGVDASGKIERIKVLKQNETPGLGDKILEIKHGEERPWFQAQFSGKTADQLILDKDGGTIESVTGATITCRTVTKSIREGLKALKEKINGFPEG